MNSFNSTKLSNGIELIHKHNANTPRIALNLFVNGGNRSEEVPGLSDITTRLLLKGTTNRTAEQIASESDENAIELDVDIKQDYSRLRTLCLNDDIDKAIDLLSDVVQNPTFEQVEKEKRIVMGELEQELDSPKAKASDNLVKSMYPNHPYGTVASIMLENIEKISLDKIKNLYDKTIKGDNISIIAVGDIQKEELISKLEEKFNKISSDHFKDSELAKPELKENKLVTICKEDASQAQVLRGWFGPTITAEDYVPLTVLNNILGSAGLSCRLFVELRDKKGLAYNVRSSVESLKYGGNITVYIGTEPKNIKVALEGFDEEIEKLKNILVSEEELESAKKNMLGKRSIFHETNSQQCYYLGIYHILGAGAGFDEKIPELIKKATREELQHVANKYFNNNYITSVLAPSEFINKAFKE